MRRLRDDLVYRATAPIRLFGRSRAFRWSLVGLLVAGASFAAVRWALDTFASNDAGLKQALAKLPAPPPLPAVARTSYVIAPVAIALDAIRDRLEATAPREFTGKNDNPVNQLLSQVDVNVALSRGPLRVSGQANELAIQAPLSGSIQLAGQLAKQAGNLSGTLAGLLGGELGKQVGNLTTQIVDQRAELRGAVTVRAKPALTAQWRLEPNLSAQTALNNTALSVGGIRINTANEVRPLLDQAAGEQVTRLESLLRQSPMIEQAAREQWSKMCRSIPLGGKGTDLPELWLEMRPVRAAAAQPEIDARNVTLTVGVQAETRIIPNATKPVCPFPAALELVPSLAKGKIAVGLPIDLPFKEANKLLSAQLTGRRFPDEKNAPVQVEIKRVSLAAAGEQLLIALHVTVHEKKTWFGLGADADVLIRGKPVLDAKAQMLRLTDIALAIDSDAGYGLLGAAARAAVPYLQEDLAKNAVVDLKPFLADAKAKIAAALADFRKDQNGVRVDAAIDDLRLTGIAFDAEKLRIIAEANGTAKVAVSKLSGL
jgi:hypothetical protein